MRVTVILGLCITMLNAGCTGKPEPAETEGATPANETLATPPEAKVSTETPAAATGKTTDSETSNGQVQSETPVNHLPPVADIEPASGPQTRAPLDDDPPPAKPFHEPGEITPVTTRRP